MHCFFLLSVYYASKDVNVATLLGFHKFLGVFFCIFSLFFILWELNIFSSTHVVWLNSLFLCFASYGCCHPCCTYNDTIHFFQATVWRESRICQSLKGRKIIFRGNVFFYLVLELKLWKFSFICFFYNIDT